jgi:plasmid replication initiation protein
MTVSEIPKKRYKRRLPSLLPNRHPTSDFFVCDILDAPLKDDLASMEHPIFSLSTKADTAVRFYEHNGNTVQISPSVLGLATIHDKDILIYCISQLMAKINRGEKTNRTVRIQAHDLLVSTNRDTGGRDYKLLKNAFERLRGTSITTDIRTNDERIISGFGLIDSWEIVVKDPKTERMVEVQVTLSKWMYNSVLGREVLTLSRDYFRIRKPLERRIYEIARKHCGSKIKWSIDIETLRKKCGSSSPPRLFRSRLGEIIREQHLPDYTIHLEDDIVSICSRKPEEAKRSIAKYTPSKLPPLKTETIQRAKKIAAGYDIYTLEQEWRNWWNDSGQSPPKSVDAAFIGFCKKRYGKDKNPAQYAMPDLFDENNYQDCY